MSTLADSFLDDLDDLENEDDMEADHAAGSSGQSGREGFGSDDDDEDEDEDAEIGATDETDIDRKLVHLVKSKVASTVGQLRKSAAFQKLKADILAEQASPDSEEKSNYDLILASNKTIHDIDGEIAETHRFIAETYGKKFPELESLIPNKIDFARTVSRIGNEVDMTLIELADILSPATVMVVSVTGSTTSGKPLSDRELTDCLSACEEVIRLDADKAEILAFVESQMKHLAPNLCALIGSRIAAQLVGLAGGVVALSKIPACNIQVLGQEKRHLAGYSAVAALPHTGILYYCDLIQSCPPFLRRKALKFISAKVALMARVDSYKNSSRKSAASEGIQTRLDMEEKIDKMQEAPKARTKKALPIPEEKKKSRRGGKRVRKMKERYAVTELRQQQNKMNFKVDEGEYGDSAMGVDVGLVGRKDSGKIRGPVLKESQLGKRQKKAITASSGQTNGLSSSLVFTPVQGMELVNPNAAAERVKAANNKWFNAYSGFMSAAPPK